VKLVIATHNRAKAGEMEVIMRELLPGWEFSALADYPGAAEPEETADTYAENATIKAEAAAAFTGELCIADDAGLEVDALGGAPGVKSKRFEGESTPFDVKIARILQVFAADPSRRRSARFRCCVAIARGGAPTQVFEAVKEGEISPEPRGARGFGYDPIFLLPELGKTYAELDPDQKNRISHRGIVLRKAAEWLRSQIDCGPFRPFGNGV
jgi:XTP/dITP diphosphohydrolase